MKFEKIIKNLSATVAAVVVFFMAGGMYLSSKGFTMLENGDIVLVPSAIAQDESGNVELPVIPDNLVLPNDHFIGKEDAPISLYEYSSFGCSHCADFHLQVLPKIKEEYIDKGLLKLFFVPFPIDKASMDGALLAECVTDDKYFDFVNVLFKKQRAWRLDRNPQNVMKQFALLYGGKAELLDACLHNDDNAREILSNRQNARSQLGIQGTPSFVISVDGKSELIPGYRPFEEFKAIIESKLPKKIDDIKK